MGLIRSNKDRHRLALLCFGFSRFNRAFWCARLDRALQRRRQSRSAAWRRRTVVGRPPCRQRLLVWQIWNWRRRHRHQHWRRFFDGCLCGFYCQCCSYSRALKSRHHMAHRFHHILRRGYLRSTCGISCCGGLYCYHGDSRGHLCCCYVGRIGRQRRWRWKSGGDRHD